MKILSDTDSNSLRTSDNDLFDAPMGSYVATEVCNLIVSFLLNYFKKIIKSNHFGFYRDDDLWLSIN